MSGPVKNTDRELWREPTGDAFHAPSIHVTEAGGVGIDVSGNVFVKTLRAWHKLAEEANRVQTDNNRENP